LNQSFGFTPWRSPALMALAAATLLTGLLALCLLPGSARSAFPGKNGPIAFERYLGWEEGGDQIFVIQPDGSGLRQIIETREGFQTRQPSLDSGSERVTYIGVDENSPKGEEWDQVYVADLDGTGATKLTASPRGNSEPSFSPDGEWIVFTRFFEEGDVRIYKIRTDGTEETEIHSGGWNYSPEFSPDGSKIAFLVDGAIRMIDADGKNEAMVADGARTWGGTRLSFSPDGTRIAFESNEAVQGQTALPRGIHAVNLDGTGREVLVPAGNLEFFDPMFSPDGGSLLFNQSQMPGRRLELTPQGFGFNIGNLATGAGVLLPNIEMGSQNPFWGNLPDDPDPEPEPKPECRMRFTKARFFVFKKKPVYRLVAKYWSKEPGQVEISFFARNADGSRGKSMGSLTRAFQSEGRFRIRHTVGKQRIRQLRKAKHGFIADFQIKGGTPDYCEIAASLDLTDRQFVKKQFVWFVP